MSRGARISILLFFAAAVLCLAPFCGLESIPFRALWGNVDDYAKVDILWHLRIPRVVLAFLAGAALAVSGMTLQALFRHSLATPLTLGISSGAALGAVTSIHWQWTFAVLGVSSISMSAVAGAALTIVLVYFLIARSRQGSSTGVLLLTGAALGLLFSSLILFLQYVNDFTRTFHMLRWVVGGLEGVVNFHDVMYVVPFMATGCLVVWYLLHELNLLATGEDFAFSRGVNVIQAKVLLLAAVALMVGGVAAVCGPIGFVGLVAPQLCRLLVGPDHRHLFPATWLLGGALLVICDTVSRMAIAPAELPVGIFTIALGVPFFLWLLLARRRELGDV
jgi:iron complex transport system permease protein